jgi:POT family proton-dependent oligopeptide transporter
MNKVCISNGLSWKELSLLFSIFSICLATYIIVPLLPIYFVESLANGGLAWSKADAFSLYGTFLALIYLSPFFGGLLGDFVLGKSFTAFLGYGFITSGLSFFNMFASKNVLYFALLLLALGFGFVKVSLTAAIGRVSQEIRQKTYEYYYLASCLGFIAGGFLSNPLFNSYTMKGVLAAVLCCTIASVIFFFGFFGREVFRRSLKERVSHTPSSSSTNTGAFFVLLALGVPFFVCSCQLTTGIPIFMHQCVNRTFFGWTIPTLWFGAIGSLIMTLVSPWLRKSWSHMQTYSQKVEPLKFSVGFTIIAASLALTSILASIYSSFIPSVVGVVLLLCVHMMSCIADFHVRPVLYA